MISGVSNVSSASTALSLLEQSSFTRKPQQYAGLQAEASNNKTNLKIGRDGLVSGTVSAADLLEKYDTVVTPDEPSYKGMMRIQAELRDAAAKGKTYKVDHGEVHVAGVILVPFGSNSSQSASERVARQNGLQMQAAAFQQNIGQHNEILMAAQAADRLAGRVK